MENLGQIIASNLIFLRKNAGLTQLEFGEKFNYTDKTVSRWENGSVLPSIEVLKDIADFYGVSVDYLITEHQSVKEFNSSIGKTVNPGNKIAITALIVTVLWTIAMTIYVASIYNLGTADPTINRWWTTFIWAIPFSFLTMSFFTVKWFKNSKLAIIFLSVFVWTILGASFIEFLNLGTYWYLFFIGLPIQVALVLISFIKR